MADIGFPIKLDHLSKSYNHKTNVIDQMNLDVVPGEFLVLLGPSGCGKSTTLRLIAGLENPTDGRILIDGKDASRMNAIQRSIAMVFQDYALYPNMTVYQNLEYALRVRKVPKKVRTERLAVILDSLNLSDYKDRYPAQLSGGQKQRVALGRGMAKKSKIFLLDEPLSNIDVQLREKARDEIQRLHATNNQTIIYVTHDQQEAMALGDRIAVMDRGKIQMIDTPENLYRNPATLFVAQFVGTPQINTFQVTYTNGQLLNQNQEVIATMAGSSLKEGATYIVGIRPENVKVSVDQTENGFPAKIETVVDYGRYKQLTLRMNGDVTIKAVVNEWPDDLAGDQTVFVRLPVGELLFFDGETRRRVTARDVLVPVAGKQGI